MRFQCSRAASHVLHTSSALVVALQVGRGEVGAAPALRCPFCELGGDGGGGAPVFMHPSAPANDAAAAARAADRAVRSVLP